MTLAVRDSTIEYVVNELARQAHLHASYPTNPVLTKRISVHLDHVNVMDAFAVVLNKTGLMVQMASDGETIVLRMGSGATVGTERRDLAGGTIVGRVTDSASGQSVSGASVRVAGVKNLSAVTSDSGNFTLRDVPAGDQVLLVRMFGYKPAERTVTVTDSQRTSVRIVLVPVPTILSGVVTTATGLQRKVEVGNDITSLNVDSIMRIAPIRSVTDLLETRVPGMTVLHTSGVPGDPARIRLRGASSVLGNNDPIVIVDGVRVYASQSDARNNNLAPTANGGSGVIHQSNNINLTNATAYAAPSPLDQIDPNSIATIEVFKGPSASALYGSDAANGVIVITTKRGLAGPTHWSLNLGQGVNWLPGAWPVNYYKFGYDVQNSLSPLCAWNDLSCHVDSLVPFQALNDPRFSVFSHGSDQTASLSVSGGVPTVLYSLTGSAEGTVGNLKLPAIEQQRYQSLYGPIPGWMVRPDNLTSYGGTGQIAIQATPALRVTVSSVLNNKYQQRSSLENSINQLEGRYLSQAVLDTTSTPLIQSDVERATDKQLSSTNALTVAWQPASWLPLTATAGLNTIQRLDETLIPFGVHKSGIEGIGTDTTGSYGLGRGTSQDNTLTVGTVVPLKRVNVAIGANFTSQSTADFQAYTSQLSPGVTEPSTFPLGTPATGQLSSFGQSTLASSTYGWYVEPRLNIASKFFVAPGFRLDGGSASGTHGGLAGGGLTPFPKIDLSYVAVDQSRPRGILTLLRPRVAIGYAGTQPGPADKLRLINAQGAGGVVALNDSTLVPIAVLSTLGNTALRPERSSELEGGFDAELWRGRLSLTYTQYNKTRRNAILSIPVAPSAGAAIGSVISGSTSGDAISSFGSDIMYSKNIGVIRNTGTELSATALVFQSRALSWTVGANLSNDNSLVVSLNKGQQAFCIGGGTPLSGSGCIVPGYPLFSDFTRPIVSFVDANHNGIIEPNEFRVGDSAAFVGQADPKYQFNLNTGVTLLNGRLSINAGFAYQNGMTQNNLAALQNGTFLSILNQPNTSLATQAAVVAAECANEASNNTAQISCTGPGSSIGVYQTVNTFRFQSLSVNYMLPTTLTHWVHVPRMSVALQGSNLALHSNYRGKDPSVNAFSTVSAGDETEDLGQIPEPRTWSINLRLEY